MISLGKKMSMVMKNMTRFIQAKGPIQDEQGKARKNKQT